MLGRGTRVALLCVDTVAESAVLDAIRMLEAGGALVDLVGEHAPEIELLRRTEYGGKIAITLPAARMLDRITTKEYAAAALFTELPEGEAHTDSEVSRLLREMKAEGKPIIAFSAGRGVPAAAAEPGRGPSSTFHLRRLLAASWQNWNAIDAPRMGAAIAYYTLLSLAPLLILIAAVSSMVFHGAIGENSMIELVRTLAGQEAAGIVGAVLANAKWTTGIVAGSVSVLVLLLGASGVFLELRDSLDTVWGVRPPYGSGILSLIRQRASAFLVVICTGLALLAFFLLSTLLSAPTHLLMKFLPVQPFVLRLISLLVSFTAMTFIFALIFKLIPDIYIRWSDVWIGAAVTSALFTAGKILIALYLTRASIGSAYAAAGSVVVFLTWVYYSAQIFLLGAEFTYVYAFRHGSYAKPEGRRGRD